MAQMGKDFEICTKNYVKNDNGKSIRYTQYYIKKANGEMVELPEHVERLEEFTDCPNCCKFSYEGLWGLLDIDGRGITTAKYQKIDELTTNGRFLKMCFSEDVCQIWDTENDNFVCDGRTFSDIRVTQGFLLVKESPQHQNVEVFYLTTKSRLFSLKGEVNDIIVYPISIRPDLSNGPLFEGFFNGIFFDEFCDKEGEVRKRAHWIFYCKGVFVINISVVYRLSPKPSVSVDSQVVDFYGNLDLGENTSKANEVLAKLNNDLDAAYSKCVLVQR